MAEQLVYCRCIIIIRNDRNYGEFHNVYVSNVRRALRKAIINDTDSWDNLCNYFKTSKW